MEEEKGKKKTKQDEKKERRNLELRQKYEIIEKSERIGKMECC